MLSLQPVMQNSNIKGTLKDGTEFTTITPGYPNSDEELVKTLRDNGVDIKEENNVVHHGVSGGFSAFISSR